VNNAGETIATGKRIGAAFRFEFDRKVDWPARRIAFHAEASMDLKLAGKTALVTGASRGIGRAVAEALAAEGCHLRLAARNGDDLHAQANRLTAIAVAVHVHDLAVSAEVEALGEACGDVDILINNAGDIPTGTLWEIDGAAWRRGWDLKVFGFIDLTRIVLPRMMERGRGVIINIIGAAAEKPNPHYIAGCVGNAALNMFTDCLGAESMRHGVRVLAVNPGPIMSDRHKTHVMERAELVLGDANRYMELEANYPAGRSGNVEEVADAVVFLASDRASHISGAALRIDAGLTVMPRKG
jgi:NAD(P)-dependent dehydrogenase (short-subunit alcohol dehydrogenase family)